MNAKKAKSLRKAVHNAGMHPRAIELIPTKPEFIPAPLINFAGGQPQPGGPGAHFLGRRYLQPSCGRGAYQKLKRAVLRGEVA
jgi:hypothetical protein